MKQNKVKCSICIEFSFSVFPIEVIKVKSHEWSETSAEIVGQKTTRTGPIPVMCGWWSAEGSLIKLSLSRCDVLWQGLLVDTCPLTWGHPSRCCMVMSRFIWLRGVKARSIHRGLRAIGTSGMRLLGKRQRKAFRETRLRLWHWLQHFGLNVHPRFIICRLKTQLMRGQLTLNQTQETPLSLWCSLTIPRDGKTCSKALPFRTIKQVSVKCHLLV